MDLSTIVGFVTAIGLIVVGMGSGVASFADGPSALIVIGGTIGVAMMNYRFPELKNAIAVAKNAIKYSGQPPDELITTIVEHADRARKEGILALESAAEQTTDPFLKRALQMVVDGQDATVVETVLSNEIDYLRDRHKAGADIFGALAAYAPALGMIGTLIGLVLMLQNMDDPSSIGPSMAVALITTFYGALLANVVFTPIAGKLKSRSAEECLYKELALEGVLSICAGDNPRVVREKLISFLEPKLRGGGDE